MKKLFYLALVAAMAFMVGCKPAETDTTTTGTNAPANP